MKYISLPIAISFILAGCQSTPNSTQNNVESTVGVNTATPSEINDFLVNKKTTIVKKEPLAPISYTTVWDRIRDNLTFDVPHNTSVMKHRKKYLRDPYALNKLFERSEPFLYYIIEEIDKNNIPLEIALLPLVESAFDPSAVSHANAAGLWQFVPGTGTQFGLNQNWWYDGRKDVVASTQAAIKYLKYLHKFFDGDWMLALAAYNSGEGRVQRTMRKNARMNKSTDYWDLDLPKETRDYVPKLFAIIDIIDRSAELSVKLYPIANSQTVQTTKLSSQIDLTVAANIADIPVSLFKTLNPGFKQWATDPNHPVQVLLPKKTVNSFNQKLKALPEQDRMVWQRYQIKNGDSLGKIAQKFHIDMKSIQRINNIRGSQIRAGKHLLIPVASDGSNIELPKTAQAFVNSNTSVNSKKTHTVKSGDSLWDISRAYNVSSGEIARWNNISTKSTLRLGQKLTIWEAGQSNSTNGNRITYKVKRGDSFARIASKFDVKIKDLEKWNRLTRKTYLQPGQKLQIAIN
jgi:membrane-bound lytic murein transglycosylase D